MAGAPDTPKPGYIVAGRYVLLRHVGRGGMGAVWRARDERLGRPVAVKTMAKRLVASKVALDRFEREARAIAQLRSPHIVQIHDFGVQYFPYMVMELLKGQPLNVRLKQKKVLGLDEVCRHVVQICKALHVANKAGIVHRDLKPGNVFIETTDDDEETVKVIDFGLAKAFNVEGQQITQVGTLMGTPRYMSPEHFGVTKGIDTRADLWSLAVISYRALAGKSPFDGNPQEIAMAVLNEDAPSITSIDPTLSAALDVFYKRAFQRDREDRFPDARTFSAAFMQAAMPNAEFSAIDAGTPHRSSAYR